jgi:hypothetical protein
VDIEGIGFLDVDDIQLAHDRVQWQALGNGNEPSHSIKGGECFYQLSNY